MTFLLKVTNHRIKQGEYGRPEVVQVRANGRHLAYNMCAGFQPLLKSPVSWVLLSLRHSMANFF